MSSGFVDTTGWGSIEILILQGSLTKYKPSFTRPEIQVKVVSNVYPDRGLQEPELIPSKDVDSVRNFPDCRFTTDVYNDGD